MSKLLSETKSTPPDALWVEKCRGAFFRVLTTKPEATKGNSKDPHYLLPGNILGSMRACSGVVV